MKIHARALVAAALAFSAVAAGAETVSVEYLVHRKPLVAAMHASDTLTFAFYSDPKCTTLQATTQLAASAPQILFERVKSQRIQGLKGADLLRIGAVIEGAPGGAGFLRVEGVGVIPAMEICQPQANAGGELRFIDTSIADELLEIAGVESGEQLRAALEKGQLPTSVVCELLATVLAQGGTDIPMGICTGDGEAEPLDLLGSLLSLD
jgi:hypothetical protein